MNKLLYHKLQTEYNSKIKCSEINKHKFLEPSYQDQRL